MIFPLPFFTFFYLPLLSFSLYSFSFYPPIPFPIFIFTFSFFLLIFSFIYFFFLFLVHFFFFSMLSSSHIFTLCSSIFIFYSALFHLPIFFFPNFPLIVPSECDKFEINIPRQLSMLIDFCYLENNFSPDHKL